MRRLIFKQDCQGYYHVHIVFDTDCKMSKQELERLCLDNPSSDRISTHFNWFANKLNDKGYKIKVVQVLDENSEPNDTDLEVIEGARGNY